MSKDCIFSTHCRECNKENIELDSGGIIVTTYKDDPGGNTFEFICPECGGFNLRSAADGGILWALSQDPRVYWIEL